MACKIAEVNQAANSDIKAFFMDSAQIISEAYKRFNKVATFQKAQSRNFQVLMTKMVNANNE
jgi:hypothetical protein